MTRLYHTFSILTITLMQFCETSILFITHTFMKISNTDPIIACTIVSLHQTFFISITNTYMFKTPTYRLFCFTYTGMFNRFTNLGIYMTYTLMAILRFMNILLSTLSFKLKTYTMMTFLF